MGEQPRAVARAGEVGVITRQGAAGGGGDN